MNGRCRSLQTHLYFPRLALHCTALSRPFYSISLPLPAYCHVYLRVQLLFLPIHSPVSVIRRVFGRVGGFTALFAGTQPPFPRTLLGSTA